MTLSAIQYNPAPPPTDPALLPTYLQQEQVKVKAAIDFLAEGFDEVVYAPPPKPRAGMRRNADGVQWNPGSGPGLYRFDGAAWVRIEPGMQASRATPQSYMSEAQKMDVYLRVGILDVTAAIQSALDYLNSIGGGRLHLPAGAYRKADTAATLVMYSNITISGDGDATTLFHDDRDTNARRDLLVANNCNNIAFENFMIDGTLATITNETNQSQTLTGSNITGLRVENVTFRNLRYMATAFSYVRGGLITGCRFIDIQRDGARCTHSQDIRITNNQFHRVADDAVALHSIDSTSTVAGSGGVANWGAVPPGSGFVVSNNTFFACQGIKVLGGKMVLIDSNTMRYMLRGPIMVSNTSPLPEGNTPIWDIAITNNIIIDSFGNRGTDRVIDVTIRPRSKGALATQPGVLTSAFPYGFTNDIDVAGSVHIGANNVTIRGNTIAWRSKRACNFSDYGYGILLDRPGAPAAGFLDVAITDASYEAHGIVVDGPVRQLSISANQFSGGGTGHFAVLCGSTVAEPFAMDDVRLESNSVSDWPVNGAFNIIAGNAASAAYLTIKNNHFNLDPFFRSASHAADNTWTSDAAVTAILVGGTRRYLGELSGNHFRNMSRPVDTPSALLFVPLTNFAYYTPSGLGLDGVAANKGIRRVSAVPQYVSVTIDGDPTSPTFGEAVGGIPAFVASTMPTSGAYVYGHEVKAAVPINGGGAGTGYTIRGWVRKSTGSGHVLNTDWTELRTLTGT